MAKDKDPNINMENTFAHLDMGDGLGGFEGINSDTIAFPFIKILQSLSPQLKKSKAEYIEGAEPGMLYNNVTNKCYKPPVEVVVGRFDRYFVEWKPERGGFCGAHTPEDVARMAATGFLKANERGQYFDQESRNVFQETYVYYIVFPNDMEAGVCLLSLSSTQLREARRWNRLLVSTYVPGTNRRAQPYFMKWALTTPEMSNDKGDWNGFKVDFAGFVNPETLQMVCEERKALPSTVKADLALLEAPPAYDGPPTYDTSRAARDDDEDCPF